MRIKTDFVTNSSSTSFIIDDGRTIIQVAFEILDIIEKKCLDDKYTEWYKTEDGKARIDGDFSRVLNAKKQIKYLKYFRDINIFIPFTTYISTFIYKEFCTFSKIRVDTSDHHNWNSINYKYFLEMDKCYDIGHDLKFINIEDRTINSRDKSI